MRLLRLELLAFGPFTQRTLDLTAGGDGGGLHIIFGANEAGKSSAMRGLMALLYGFAERSEDDFVHRHADLRVGGILQQGSGQTLHCVRRKGRKQTLLSPDGGLLDDGALAPFLAGVDEACFRSLFAFDQAELVRGGQSVLDMRGNVGGLLFSAAMGKVDAAAWVAQLEEEARAIYLPRGSKPRLNALLESVADLRRRLQDASRSAQQWQALDAQRTALLARIHSAEQQLTAAAVPPNAETTLAERQLQSLKAQQSELTRRLQSLRADGELPNPQALAQRRQERQRLWQSLRSRMLEGHTFDAVDQPLIEQYEGAVQAVDALATSLFERATRVQQVSDAEQRLSELQRQQVAIEAQLQQLRPSPTAAQAASNPPSQLDDAGVRLLYRELGALEAELARFDGQSAAAALAEQLQLLLADVRDEAERYAQRMLEAQLLRQAIERFRDAQQATLVQAASGWFAKLTRGSFSGLQVSERMAAQPVLVGCRSQGQEVAVEGLSTGTRDQLYLALRLAAWQSMLAHREPLPLVMDDLLVHFDDERATAALEALAELSQQTQVLLFTHHRHLIGLAEGLRGTTQLQVHGL